MKPAAPIVELDVRKVREPARLKRLTAALQKILEGPAPAAAPPPTPVPAANKAKLAPKRPGWKAARAAAIVRDGGRCRKCGLDHDLEVHHVTERCDGGRDELENLCTLCHDCHCEWTFCQPPACSFELWLLAPPARLLAVAIMHSWPADVEAETFRRQLIKLLRPRMA